jgi:thioredoxin-dependent peroxiredoxin
MNVQVNKLAPNFKLPDQDNQSHQLSDYKGQWVLLYFYPKDDTPGCTTEACSLRDNLPRFNNIKAVVLGISTDSVASHKKFADKYRIPFTLLADENKQVVQQYGVWGEKKFMGRTYMGILRTSFLIDPQGKVAKIYEKVKPAVHAEQVLDDLEQLKKK